MNKLKLIAMAALFSMALTSCEKDKNTGIRPDPSQFISNYDFFLTNLQVVPATNSTGSGRIEGTYDRKAKLYSYKITWDNLSSNASVIHIHGNADRGFVALPAPLGAYTNSIVQSQTLSGTLAAKSGSLTGSLYVDGVVVKEHDLLNGKYYVDIHTVNFPATTQGEIRGQILFP